MYNRDEVEYGVRSLVSVWLERHSSASGDVVIRMTDGDGHAVDEECENVDAFISKAVDVLTVGGGLTSVELVIGGKVIGSLGIV